MMVRAEKPERCEKCGGEVVQDEDVLDTWFSSALWPFSTLGWPEKTPDYEYFFPTDVLVTGYDIIFFWVVRMVFSSLEATGILPFDHVYVHGLVRDAEGRKMSKSLGNGIDPLEIIDEYGADALRFMLTTGITPGNDMRFQKDKLEASRNFANKLWNASRFVIMNLKNEDGTFKTMKEGALRNEDKWILHRINEAAKDVTKMMDKFDLALAGQRVYELIWNEFCDWYIELVKERLYGEDEKDKENVRFMLVACLKDLLRLLHPFMPFITEEIWSYLPLKESKDNSYGFLISDRWPESSKEMEYKEAVEVLERAMEIIKAVRNIRSEVNAPMSKKLTLILDVKKNDEELVKAGLSYIKRLTNAGDIKINKEMKEALEDVMSTVVTDTNIYIPKEDLIDYKEEYERLLKEKEKLVSEVERVNLKLSNKAFLEKAPPHLVSEEKEKEAKYKNMLDKLVESITLIERKL